MTTDYPLVTIGFTCFNAADSIAKAIRTAQNQTWPNLDILVVDDGSSDNSVEVVNELIKNDPSIRLIEHVTNKGTAIARNTLSQNVKGEFITYFDDDDEAMLDRVEKQYNRLIAYEQEHQGEAGIEMVFCYCGRNVVLEGQDTIDHTGHGIGRNAPEPHGQIVADYLLWNTRTGLTGQMGSGTLLMRSNVFEKIGFFDERFRRSAELELAVRAALKGAHFISVDEPLIKQNKTLTTDKGGKKPLQYALLLREAHKDYLQSRGLYLASRAVAHAVFYAGRGERIKNKIALLLANILAPHEIMKRTIKQRL